MPYNILVELILEIVMILRPEIDLFKKEMIEVMTRLSIYAIVDPKSMFPTILAALFDEIHTVKETTLKGVEWISKTAQSQLVQLHILEPLLKQISADKGNC